MSRKKIENLEKKDNERKAGLFCVFPKLVHLYKVPMQSQRAFMDFIGIPQRNTWFKKWESGNEYLPIRYFDDIAAALEWDASERANWMRLWENDRDIYERLSIRGRPKTTVENIEKLELRIKERPRVRVLSYVDIGSLIGTNSFQGRLIALAYFVTNGNIGKFKPVKKLSLQWWNKFLNAHYDDDEAISDVITEVVGGGCSHLLSRWLTKGRTEHDLLILFDEYRASIQKAPSGHQALKA